MNKGGKPNRRRAVRSRPKQDRRLSRTRREYRIRRVVHRTPGPLYRWTVHENRGMVTITGPGGIPVLDRFWTEIELENGDVLTTCQSGLSAGPGFWFAELANGSIVLELSIKRSPDPAGVLLAATIRNRGVAPVAVRAVRIARMVMDRPPKGWGTVEGWRILRMGYAPGTAHREDRDAGNSSLLSLALEDAGTRSWGAVAMELPGPAGGLVAGFVTSARQMAWLDLRRFDGSVDISASCETAGESFGPGEALVTETLYLGLAMDPAAALSAYARMAGHRGGVRLKSAPRGWTSRYLPAGDVAEEKVLEIARFVSARRKQVALDVIQLDDGYMKAYGDWLETNDRFPGGLEALGKQVSSLGLTPGIWLAPFVAQPSSRLFKDHPEWMVKDSSGRPLAWETDKEGDGPWYALDGGHPGAGEWLTGLFSALHGYGFRYFMLDFLFMGCIPGVRSQPGTRIMAYRRGLSAIRAGAGNSYITGCAGPYPPSIGLVDGMRVSGDARSGTGPWESFHSSFRETHQRFWSHRALWNNDCDALVLRPDSGSPDGLAGAIAASAALSGGALFSGDDLPELPSDGMALLVRTLEASRERAAVPLDLFSREYPRILVARDGDRLRAGLFNDGASPRSIALDLNLLGLSRARVVRTDGARPENLGKHWRSALLPPVPARGAMTIEILKD